MEKNSTAMPKASLFDGTAGFDPIEAGLWDYIRGFTEAMLEEKLTAALRAALAVASSERQPP
jgi:hypothetical protein